LSTDCSEIAPSAAVTRRNFSQVSAAARLAMSGPPPALSTLTYLPLATFLSETVPSALCWRSNVSQVSAAARLAMSGPPARLSMLT